MSRPVGSRRRSADTTAEIIRQLRSSERTPCFVALGVALHHFTDVVAGLVPLDRAEAHAATTILTKQVADVLDAGDDDAWRRLADLVVDPDRVAAHDGRTVARLCGDRWPAVAAEARKRAAATMAGVESYGAESVAQLASIRGYRTAAPWWGTDAWYERIDRWLGDARLSPMLAAALRRAPEEAPLDVLRDVLRD